MRRIGGAVDTVNCGDKETRMVITVGNHLKEEP